MIASKLLASVIDVARSFASCQDTSARARIDSCLLHFHFLRSLTLWRSQNKRDSPGPLRCACLFLAATTPFSIKQRRRHRRTHAIIRRAKVRLLWPHHKRHYGWCPLYRSARREPRMTQCNKGRAKGRSRQHLTIIRSSKHSQQLSSAYWAARFFGCWGFYNH